MELRIIQASGVSRNDSFGSRPEPGASRITFILLLPPARSRRARPAVLRILLREFRAKASAEGPSGKRASQTPPYRDGCSALSPRRIPQWLARGPSLDCRVVARESHDTHDLQEPMFISESIPPPNAGKSDEERGSLSRCGAQVANCRF